MAHHRRCGDAQRVAAGGSIDMGVANAVLLPGPRLRALPGPPEIAEMPGNAPLTIQRHACGMRPPKNQFQRGVRRSRHIQARLVQHGCADRPCVVSDVSTHGAKIVVSGEAAVPTHFELAFDNAGTQRLCELVWWRGKTAGVKFVR